MFGYWESLMREQFLKLFYLILDIMQLWSIVLLMSFIN